MYDAIVIGGGVVGSSTAYHLVCEGAKTLLIDREDLGRATNAGAGILSPQTYYNENTDAWFNFAVEAVAYYPTLVEQLHNEQAGVNTYGRCGKLLVAIDKDEIEAFERAKDRIFGRQKRRGLPAPDELYEISSREARQLFPALAPVYGAIYYHNAARVDARLLSQALRRAGKERGLVIKRASAERLLIQHGSVTGAVVDGTPIMADKVAISGGAWSSQFGEQLNVHIPIKPQRGQIIHLSLPGTDTTNWPIVSSFHGHYILPWPDSRIAIGATREYGSGFEAILTAEGMQEVLTEALRVAPGLAKAQIQQMRVGLRPLTSDKSPVLGRVPEIENIYLVTGHGATGLQAGPYSGKVIAELMVGKEDGPDISAFNVTRFAAPY